MPEICPEMVSEPVTGISLRPASASSPAMLAFRRLALAHPQVRFSFASEIGVDAAVIAGFARRSPTQYEQLASIKRRHGFRDLTHPDRAGIARWLLAEAIGLNDGRVLLDRLIS